MTDRPVDEWRIAYVADVLSAHTPSVQPIKDRAEHAAVAILLRCGQAGGIETLFIKRVEHPGDPWSGHMAFPGGRMSRADKDIESAAARETGEEVGIELNPELMLGRLDDIDGGARHAFTLWVTPFVYRCPEPADITLSREVADIVWVPLGYLGDTRNVVPYRSQIAPADYLFPSFKYGQYTIWGLTYRILTSFFSLFEIHLPPEPMTRGNAGQP